MYLSTVIALLKKMETKLEGREGRRGPGPLKSGGPIEIKPRDSGI